MIPPLAPEQSDEGQNMVGWKNTFNMRQVTLMNLAANHLSLHGNNQQRHSNNFMQNGCITSPIKSLDILRKNLQNAINKDIDIVIKKYLEKFFQPAVNNIRNNLGRDSINEEHIKEACVKILEEAKLMYKSTPRSRDSSPYDYSDSETGSLLDYKFGTPLTTNSLFRKRKESDTDSETSNSTRLKRSKLQTNPTNDIISVAQLPVKREGPKWNPERINTNTLFIIGAKASKALGYGQTRGKLYMRHPELVRYSGDQEDKDWLIQHGYMSPTSGKPYLMILEDIKELTLLDEYRNNPNVQLSELRGFEVPAFMVHKVRIYMESMRTDMKIHFQVSSLDLFDFQTSQSMTPPSTALDSAPSTPSDTLQMLECQSASTISSKQSDTTPFIQIPDVSPGSNHSFISGPLTQSPLPTAQVALSPSLLVNFTTQPLAGAQHPPVTLELTAADSNHSNLSVLLASHITSDHSDEQDF